MPLPSNVNRVTSVPGGMGKEMGVQVQIQVSWDEVGGPAALHQHDELWVHVLSTQPMNPTNVLPEEIISEIAPVVLAAYNHRVVCGWFPDNRTDDDETVIEWPYEQHWALPRLKVIG